MNTYEKTGGGGTWPGSDLRARSIILNRFELVATKATLVSPLESAVTKNGEGVGGG